MELPNKYKEYLQTKEYLENLEKTCEELRKDYCRKCLLPDECGKCRIAALIHTKEKGFFQVDRKIKGGVPMTY